MPGGRDEAKILSAWNQSNECYNAGTLDSLTLFPSRRCGTGRGQRATEDPMEVVPRHGAATAGRYPHIDAVAHMLQAWFSESVQEPIPEKLASIVQKLETEPSVVDTTASPRQRP
jgi:hypothetical protein